MTKRAKNYEKPLAVKEGTEWSDLIAMSLKAQPEKKLPKNLIFLDIDGVLNCQLFYDTKPKKTIYEPSDNIDPVRVGWLNELCDETDSAVVISSTWRMSGLEYCTKVLREAGATFTILDITPRLHIARGCEIDQWLRDNCMIHFGVHGHDFYRYAIIDDDSDMLLNQEPHFFHTDNYSGLTPNTCYRIKRFFTHKTF